MSTKNKTAKNQVSDLSDKVAAARAEVEAQRTVIEVLGRLRTDGERARVLAAVSHVLQADILVPGILDRLASGASSGKK